MTIWIGEHNAAIQELSLPTSNIGFVAVARVVILLPFDKVISTGVSHDGLTGSIFLL